MVLEGFKTLPMIYRKVSEEIRSNWSIYEKSRIRLKDKPRRWTTIVMGPQGAHPWPAA
jgi:hypothetical protein